TAIGLHNFAEGLAIGVSARAGEIGLATVLIIGFAAHNATEGFGIVGPLGAVKPSWRWLATAGLTGGALLYVIGEIWNGVRRLGHRQLGMYMLFVGLFAGFVTDLIVSYGGA